MSNSDVKKGSITIKDIALLANVSQSTVSKALNDRPDVNTDTREHIKKIAEKHNFRPNVFGKALKSQTTESIGVLICREILPPSDNPFYSRVMEGIEAELAVKNYSMTLDIVNGRDKNAVPKVIRERRVDGMILMGVFDKQYIDMIMQYDIPVAFIDPKITLDAYDQVLIDNEHGAQLAVDYLISLGHKHIGFVSGSLNRSSFQQRYVGYRDTLAYHNLPLKPEWVQAGGLEEGYNQIKSIIELESRPTAIFCANDINAIKGYRAIHERGLNIPGDISIVGFDDIEFGKHSNPALTSVRVYKEELGSIAVRGLFKRFKDTSRGPTTTVVPVKLIIRDSAASPAG